MKLFEQLVEKASRLSATAVANQACVTRATLRRWRAGQTERKARQPKLLPESTVENAAALVGRFPHLGGRKAQGYMLYHQSGVIGQHAYDAIRRNVRRLLQQELARRPDRPWAIERYDHIRPNAPGDIWAEDFTELPVEAVVFRVAIVLDVLEHYYLGWASRQRATAALVADPVCQALAANGGKGPKSLMLSDNGSVYTCDKHEQLLSSAEIVHQLIPACTPQYNGTIESEMGPLKSLFYCLWEEANRQAVPDPRPLPERVNDVLAQTIDVLNNTMPRPFLGNVTPADVRAGRQEEVKARINAYKEQNSNLPVPPWERDYWQVLADGAGIHSLTTKELRTKLAFFGRKPLRRIAAINREGVR